MCLQRPNDQVSSRAACGRGPVCSGHRRAVPGGADIRRPSLRDPRADQLPQRNRSAGWSVRETGSEVRLRHDLERPGVCSDAVGQAVSEGHCSSERQVHFETGSTKVRQGVHVGRGQVQACEVGSCGSVPAQHEGGQWQVRCSLKRQEMPQRDHLGSGHLRGKQAPTKVPGRVQVGWSQVREAPHQEVPRRHRPEERSLRYDAALPYGSKI